MFSSSYLCMFLFRFFNSLFSYRQCNLYKYYLSIPNAIWGCGIVWTSKLIVCHSYFMLLNRQMLLFQWLYIKAYVLPLLTVISPLLLLPHFPTTLVSNSISNCHFDFYLRLSCWQLFFDILFSAFLFQHSTFCCFYLP